MDYHIGPGFEGEMPQQEMYGGAGGFNMDQLKRGISAARKGVGYAKKLQPLLQNLKGTQFERYGNMADSALGYADRADEMLQAFGMGKRRRRARTRRGGAFTMDQFKRGVSAARKGVGYAKKLQPLLENLKGTQFEKYGNMADSALGYADKADSMLQAFGMGRKRRGLSAAMSARNAKVKQIMRAKGVSLPEASRILKRMGH